MTMTGRGSGWTKGKLHEFTLCLNEFWGAMIGSFLVKSLAFSCMDVVLS